MISVRVALFLFASVCLTLAQIPAPAMPPLPSITNTPAQGFRKLLAMNETEREQFIGARAKGTQPFLRAKVQEYLALSVEDREVRLQMLELRSLMLPLMSTPEPLRTAQVQMLPPDKRKIVEDRLRTWTILPPPLAQDVLKNELAARFFLDAQTSTNSAALLSSMSPQQRTDWEKRMADFNALPAQRREIAVQNVERYFGLDARKRDETLNALSGRERAMITTNLARLGNLTPTERSEAVDGLKKFKGLSAADQQEFLRSATRWQAMNEKDRRLWREIVARTRPTISPPMPPSPDQRTRKIVRE